MIDDPLALLSMGVWLFAAGMWPVAFLFGACSPCCQTGDPCPWLLEFDRCLRVSVVGSDPPDGGDCRIVSSRAGTGDVEYMTSTFLQIHNVQSRIRITVRLSLSASGTSRTPVGETRTQVWRFNRATPSSPAQSTYDVLGPPWHLQVDLSVTGVATQAEAGVVSSLASDEHGQPKLVLTVNQWTATITHDEVVTLFPVGLQRWGPGLGGTQLFRLTASSATATLTSGTSYSGWSVSKQTGLTIDERKFAARLVGTLCTGGAGGTLTERIILDDEAAVEFLNGDEELQVTVGTGTRDLRILSNSELCEASRDLVGMGVSLGIYPEEIYADVPSSVIESNAAWCTEEATFALKPNSNICPTSWASVQYIRPSLTFPATAISLVASNFWPGRTLLWNLEQGPYRTSFTGTGPPSSTAGWTYRIDGDGSNLDGLFLSPASAVTCRLGLVANSGVCIPASLTASYGESTVAIEGRYSETLSGGKTICDTKADWTATLTVPAGSLAMTGTFFGGDIRDGSQLVAGGGGLVGVPPGDKVVSFRALNAWSSIYGGFPRFPVTISPSILFSEVWISGEANPTTGPDIFLHTPFNLCSIPNKGAAFSGPVFLSSGPFYLADTGGSQRGRWDTAEHRAFVCGGGLVGNPNAPPRQPFTTLDQVQGDIAHQLRRVCGQWSPNPVSAEGETITRDCEITDSEVVTETVTETFNVPASRSRLSKTLGRYPNGYGEADQLTQLGRCRLLGLRDMRGSTTATVAATVTLGSAPATNSCFSYLPMFGETAGTLCSGDLSSFTAVPCDNCTVSVTQTAGEENASVRLITSGDKAGLIEINVKRLWPSGEGVTFTVSCGGDTITQVVKRA